MTSKLKPNELRNLAPAKDPSLSSYKSRDKKESQERAIQKRKEELARAKNKGHASVWFMCILSILFLAFGYGYELGVDRKNNPLPPIQIKCIKKEI